MNGPLFQTTRCRTSDIWQHCLIAHFHYHFHEKQHVEHVGCLLLQQQQQLSRLFTDFFFFLHSLLFFASLQNIQHLSTVIFYLIFLLFHISFYSMEISHKTHTHSQTKPIFTCMYWFSSGLLFAKFIPSSNRPPRKETSIKIFNLFSHFGLWHLARINITAAAFTFAAFNFTPLPVFARTQQTKGNNKNERARSLTQTQTDRVAPRDRNTRQMFSVAALERHHAAWFRARFAPGPGSGLDLGCTQVSRHRDFRSTFWSTFHAPTLSGEQWETPESGGVERESDSPCDVPRADLRAGCFCVCVMCRYRVQRGKKTRRVAAEKNLFTFAYLCLFYV